MAASPLSAERHTHERFAASSLAQTGAIPDWDSDRETVIGQAFFKFFRSLMSLGVGPSRQQAFYSDSVPDTSTV